MGIYIPDLEDDVALEKALEIMTDEWIEAGNYADQTIVDLRDEAVSLRARVARLEEALKEIATLYWVDAPAPEEMRRIARRALEEK